MIMFRRRAVRLHQMDPGPSIEGVLVGKPWRCSGHYVLRKSSILVAEGSNLPTEGQEVWVPREKVLFVEVMSR